MFKSEKILRDILFRDNNKEFKRFSEKTQSELIKISSMHLMIPALYLQIKRKKITKLFLVEFISYIRKIYVINKNRNTELIKEALLISKKFKKERIDHVFLKGTALITGEYFNDIGERMIGDIDILVNKQDLVKAIKVSKEMGYKSKNNLKYLSNSRHYPRMICENKIFAIEIHEELIHLNKKSIISSESVLKNKIIGKINIPTKKNIYLHSIYNYQINDLGSSRATFSYRTIYDTVNLNIKEYINFNKNIYIKRYYMILSHLNISNIKIKKKNSDKVFMMRHKIKIKNNIYFKIDDFLFINLFLLPKRVSNIKLLFFNKNYRNFLFMKYFKT